MKVKRNDLISALIDCFGYSRSEFDGVDKKTIITYMTDDQKAIVKSYLNFKKAVLI